MTTAKEVLVSADGSTWYTLPGGTGEWSDEGDQINDTIFGQTFQSTQPGLITWNANANALYKGFAGYVASIKRSGTPTTLTNEACSLVSGKTYQITNTAKRVLDPDTAVVVKGNAVTISAANILSIDHMFGLVTFIPSYTPTTPITISGNYLPMTEVAKANSFTLTQTVETIDETDFATARANGGYRVFQPGLRTVAVELGGFYDAATEFWTLLESRENVIIEINPDGSGNSIARGIFKMVSRSQSGDVGALEEETRTFNLSVPDNIDTVFRWWHDTDTTMSQAIRVLLTAFEGQSLVSIRYLPEGTSDQTGFEGEAVVTDVSLSSGLDAMNEFTANFQGSDAPTRGIISD